MGFNRRKSSYNFSELLKGLQEAVNSAQELLEVQQLNSFHKYFDAEGNVLVKKLNPGTGKELSVPILSIIPQNTLLMEQVEIEFDARLQAVKPKAVTGCQFHTVVENAEVELGTAAKKDSDLVHVKVKFKSTQIPEGMSKVIDECNKIIS